MEERTPEGGYHIHGGILTEATFLQKGEIVMRLILSLLMALVFLLSGTANSLIAATGTAQDAQPSASASKDHEDDDEEDDDEDEDEDEDDEDDNDAVLDFKMKTIDGKEVHLGKTYDDKVILIVNVASRCGYTKQYAGLQKLHEKYSKQGLVILGFPCNQFGGQEPGSEEQIAEFCEAKFGVKFPMFAKIDVNGDSAAPLYKYLTDKKKTSKSEGPIKWNFEKFLIDHEERVVGHYRSSVTPEELEKTIVKLLKERKEEEGDDADDDGEDHEDEDDDDDDDDENDDDS